MIFGARVEPAAVRREHAAFRDAREARIETRRRPSETQGKGLEARWRRPEARGKAPETRGSGAGGGGRYARMSRTEYKTVAMPQLVRGRRRRGQSRGEMIAETLSRVINEQSQSGWSYVGADHFRTIERAGLFRPAEEVVYTVLVFERSAPERRERKEPPLRAEPEPIRSREPEMRPRGPAPRRESVDDEPAPRRRPGEFVRRRPTYDDR